MSPSFECGQEEWTEEQRETDRPSTVNGSGRSYVTTTFPRDLTVYLLFPVGNDTGSLKGLVETCGTQVLRGITGDGTTSFSTRRKTGCDELVRGPKGQEVGTERGKKRMRERRVLSLRTQRRQKFV